MHQQDLSLWGLTRDENGAIVIDGHSCGKLAEQFNTPLHVVSKSKLLETVNRFTTAFCSIYEKTEIMYAYKAGSVPGTLQVIHSQNVGAEVISGYELWLALRVGVLPSMIVFNGPLKTNEDLNLAIGKEIFSINIDSIDDLSRIEQVAREIGKPANVGVRLAVKGGYSNFGIPVINEIFFEVMDQIVKSNWLNYRGLMTHLGGRSTDAVIFIRGIEIMSKLANAIQERYSIDTAYFDVGGGFGVETLKGLSLFENALYRKFNIPVKPPQKDLYDPIEKVATDTVAALRRECEKYHLKLPRLVVEPGRAIVSQPQLLLLRIHSIKQNGKQYIAVSDGGRFNVNYPVDHEYHEIFLANRDSFEKQQNYFIAGRISTVGDFVHRNKALPELKVGDVIAVMDSGAYFTQFSTNFSFARPTIVMVDQGEPIVIRKRESYEQLISNDKFHEYTK